MAYTIPREIIKWIQGLDLSYSYKDSKRDLMNGFLIAEILARYYPDKVQMHSFDNSGNAERRANNWMLLGKFFQKNELPFTKDDYSKILDNDFEALKTFLVKLYTMMTNRKVSKPPLSTLQHTGKESLNTRNDTELGTFLLRDKGLEPIKNIDEGLGTGDKKKAPDGAGDADATKKDEKDAALASNMSPPSNTKQKNLFRIPPRPIAQNVETSNTQVDVKATNIRVLNTNIAKFRANKEVTQSISKASLQPEAFQKSNNANEPMTATGQERHSSVGGSNDTLRSSTSKKEKGVTERTIHDILNEILLSKLTHSNFHEEAQRVREIATSISLFYSERIDNFSIAFHIAFFQEVKEKCESLVNFLIRDQNELWKFFMYLFTCIKGIPTDSDLLIVVDSVLKALGEKFLARDIQRTKSIYMEYFMGTICSMLKTSMYFEKKELLVKSVYYFIPGDYASKYEVLRQFKLGLNNDLIIFSQVLAILIKEETGFTAAPNQENFYREFADYAEICFRNPVNSVRSMSLAIFCKLADLKVEMILNSVLAKIPNFSAFKWWEHKCLALILLNKTIRGITNTDAYVNFIKKQTAHVSKTYTPEHEAIIHNIRDQIDRISTCLRDLCSMNTSEQILRVALINFIPNIYEIKSLMDLFVGILLMTGENLRKWVIAANDTVYREEYLVMSDKSLKYQVSIDTTKLKDYALEIIIAVVEAIKEQELETVGQEHFDLLQFAFQHLSFDKISPEEANFIANSLKDYLCVALCDEDFYQIALDLLQRLLFLHFKDQLQIKEIETFLASALVLMRQNSLENCIKNISDYLLELHREAIDNNLENIKRFLINIGKETRSKLGEKYDEQDVLAQLMDQITLGLDQD